MVWNRVSFPIPNHIIFQLSKDTLAEVSSLLNTRTGGVPDVSFIWSADEIKAGDTYTRSSIRSTPATYVGRTLLCKVDNFCFGTGVTIHPVLRYLISCPILLT